jgi:hypothetical protein
VVLPKGFSQDWLENWKSLNADKRQEMVKELIELWNEWNGIQERGKGSQAFYQILGHKADIMFMFLRPTLDELTQIELAFNKTKFAEYTVQTTSYVSVVELSNYLPKGEDPYAKPEIRKRLYPKIPNVKYICFYYCGICHGISSWNTNLYTRRNNNPVDLAWYNDLKSASEVMCNGGSAIVGPLGGYVTEPVWGKEISSLLTLI